MRLRKYQNKYIQEERFQINNKIIRPSFNLLDSLLQETLLEKGNKAETGRNQVVYFSKKDGQAQS